MPRRLLDDDHLHPAIRDRVAGHHRAFVDEVARAVEAHPVVVVGMRQNPHVARAVRILRKAGTEPHVVLEGSYLGGWRRRTALKMWTGWPTFPMVFLERRLVGGADEVQALVASGAWPRPGAGVA